MEGWAKLITAVAALLGAVAWPAAVATLLIIFRQEIRNALAKIPSVMDRMRALKLGAITTELDRVANEAVAKPSNAGTVSMAEVQTAALISRDSAAIGELALAAQLDILCVEYDTIRRVMPPGDRRTSAMTRVFVQMRSLGPSISNRIEAYANAGSPGSRLAAVAMMQMEPNKADLPWLVERFRIEHPFIFYHAALALQNVANDGDVERLAATKAAAADALAILKTFDGTSDASSIHVLEALIADRFSGHYL